MHVLTCPKNVTATLPQHYPPVHLTYTPTHPPPHSRSQLASADASRSTDPHAHHHNRSQHNPQPKRCTTMSNLSGAPDSARVPGLHAADDMQVRTHIYT